MLYEWHHLTPPLPSGQQEFMWNSEPGSEPVICHVTFDNDEGDGFNEPVLQPCATVEKIYDRGCDVTSLLHMYVEQIESEAYEFFLKQARLGREP